MSSWGGWYSRRGDGPQCGMDWLRLLKGRFRHSIWLNPSRRPQWGAYWSETYALSQSGSSPCSP